MKVARMQDARLPGRRLTATLMMALLVLSSGMAVSAQAITLKIATLSPNGSSWMKAMKAGAKAVAEETEGRVKIRFYPGGVMGDDFAVLRKIRARQLHGAAVTVGSMTRFYPDIQIYSMPMVFSSGAEVDYVRKHMDEELLANLEEAGFVSFGFAEGGFAYAMSKKPATGLAEARSQKVWIPDGDEYSNLVMQSFGMSPVPLSVADVMAGLQTGLIDAVASPPLATLALQWHTQLDYILDLPFLYTYGVLAIDKKAFNKVNEADRAIVHEHLGKAFRSIDQASRRDQESTLAALQNQGLTLLAPDAEQSANWQVEADKATEKMLDADLVSREAYARMLALRDEYRRAQAQ